MSPGATRPGTPGRGPLHDRGMCLRTGLSSIPFSPYPLPGATRPRPRQWGPLHGGPPAPPACRGQAPDPPEPPHTPFERWHLSLTPQLFPRAHGVCRLPKASPPACLPGQELTVRAAPLRWISCPSTARRMGRGGERLDVFKGI